MKIISAPWVIPVQEHTQQVLEHHAIVIENGRILNIAPLDTAQALYPQADCEHFSEHVLIPALINAHTHAGMCLLRGFADDLPLERWLNERIWPAEGTHASAEFVYDGTQLAIAEMLLGGIGCFADMYFFPEQGVAAALDAGMRIQAGVPVINIPNQWSASTEDSLRHATELNDRYGSNALVSVALTPHAVYSLEFEELQSSIKHAEQLQVPVHIHLAETAIEVANCLKTYDLTPAQLLCSIAERTPLQVAHAIHLTSQDCELLGRQGAKAIHCPASNLKLASGLCNLQQLRQHGIRTALGTDGAASNNSLDMFSEMRLAALLGKLSSGDASAANAHDCLRMATLEGAVALGIEHETGSLEVGKSADITAVDLGHINSLPVYDPTSQLVYACNRNQVDSVWVAGERKVKQGELLDIDLGQISEKIKSWQERIGATKT